jgi:flavin reductase (DIM6/NTAB) family NADH-FMN oxidoreductase RutF
MDSQLFKQVMRGWASGVTVVTTAKGEQRVGVTVSAFSSVSAEPPLVLVCLHRKLYTGRLIEEFGVFAVNILSAGQIEVGKLFANAYPHIQDRFADLACMTQITGSPILPQVVGWFDCRLQTATIAGDHVILLGEVVAGGVDESAQPLLYHHLHWGRFVSIPSSTFQFGEASPQPFVDEYPVS